MARRIMTPEEKRTFMLTTPVHRLVPSMAVPSIVAMMIHSVHSLANAFFVAKLGTLAAGAVGVNFTLDNIILMAGSFLAFGASSFMARLMGAGRDDTAEQTLATAFFSAFFTGMLVLVLGLSFLDPMVRLFGATEAVAPYARDYGSYMLISAPFATMSLVLTQSLRAEGSAVFSMVGMCAGAVLNIVLDPLFIFVFGWGLKGAGVATVLAKCVSLLILLYPYLRRNTVLAISFKNIRYSKAIISEISKMGSPSLLRTALSTLAVITLNTLAGKYSDSALAAISIVNRIVLMLGSACLGFGQGFAPVAGFNWGAKRYDRIIASFKFASLSVIIGMSVVCALVAALAGNIMTQFTEDDIRLMEFGVFSLRIQMAAMPITAWVLVVNMMCVGLGKNIGALILGVSRQGICFFPLLPLFMRLFNVHGIMAVQGVADVLSVLLGAPICITVLRELKRRQAQEERQEATTAPAPEEDPAPIG